jgi:hypothetical protein
MDYSELINNELDAIETLYESDPEYQKRASYIGGMIYQAQLFNHDIDNKTLLRVWHMAGKKEGYIKTTVNMIKGVFIGIRYELKNR